MNARRQGARGQRARRNLMVSTPDLDSQILVVKVTVKGELVMMPSFLVWINGEGLIIRMTDLILNTLNSRDMVDILVETSSGFLTKWVLTLANG